MTPAGDGDSLVKWYASVQNSKLSNSVVDSQSRFGSDDIQSHATVAAGARARRPRRAPLRLIDWECYMFSLRFGQMVIRVVHGNELFIHAFPSASGAAARVP